MLGSLGFREYRQYRGLASLGLREIRVEGLGFRVVDLRVRGLGSLGFRILGV